jgi:hypothetical protein
MTSSSECTSGPAGQVQHIATAAPSEYYPPSASRASDRWPWVAVALVAAIAAVAVAVIVTLGREQRSASLPAVAQVATQRSSPPKVITRTLAGPSTTIIREQPVSSSAPAVPDSASGSCGGGINVNSQTSCSFAQNVVEQYTQDAEQAGAPGPFNVSAYSPVTGKSYSDSCGYNSSTAIVSCSHGSDLIQFAYGDIPAPASSSAPAVPDSTSGSCGGGITINSQTSCQFAQNVVEQYTQDAQQAGAPGPFNVSAYSPVTGKSYSDNCGYNSSTAIVSCSHGSDLVEFAYSSR